MEYSKFYNNMSEVSKKRTTVSSEVIETSCEVHITQELTESSVLINSAQLKHSETDDVSLQDLIEAELNTRLANIATSSDTGNKNEDNSPHCMSSNNSIDNEISAEDQITAELSQQNSNEEICQNNSNSLHEEIESELNHHDEHHHQQIPMSVIPTETTSTIDTDSNNIATAMAIETDIKQETHNFIENEKYFNSVQQEQEHQLEQHVEQRHEQYITDQKQQNPIIVTKEIAHQDSLDQIVQITEEVVDEPIRDDEEQTPTETETETHEIVTNELKIDTYEKPSIKDKLMLGNDEQMALLFSQTITSPAFTPTDENFDILQAIKREENSVDEFIKIESMCRDESFEKNTKQDTDNTAVGVAGGGNNDVVIQQNGGDKIILISEDISDNGEISPEDEREISQDSDFSPPQIEITTNVVRSTIKVQDSIHIIEQEIRSCDFTTTSHDDDDNSYEDELLVTKESSSGIAVPEDDLIIETNGNEDVMTVGTVETIDAIKTVDQNIENGDTKVAIDEIDDASKYFEQQPPDVVVMAAAEKNGCMFEASTKESLHSDVADVCITNRTKLNLELDSKISSTTLQQTTTVQTTETNNENNIENNITNVVDVDCNKAAQVKKKKSKKSKKEHEKENISVNDDNNISYKDYVYIEDDLSQVNVRNLKKTYCDQSLNGSVSIKKTEPIISTGVSIKELCRSFGDLTSLQDDNNTSNQNSVDSSSSPSSPESRAKSMIDLRKLGSEPLYRGVSVKALKSSFSKFDALSKKTMLHVRSSDAGKAQEKFNGSPTLIEQNCKACTKQVFQMEQIKAEKAIWHKNCFRCKECNKQLNVDTYQSHEGTLYCKPHFKALFAPKVVEESQPQRPRKPELIIRESEPVELPPGVVRASDKPDLGLEELQSLNVKERFQVFEHANEQQEQTLERTSPSVKRSSSILSKLARFQAKGMDIGVSDDALNGVPVELSPSESEDDEDLGEDADLIRAKRKTAMREQPVVFDKLNELKSRWESGHHMTKDERREECKQEIKSLRSRLFMGKQVKMKEMYQQAVAESESGAKVKKNVPTTEINENAKLIKEKFERGEVLSKEDENIGNSMEEDMSIFEAGISKKSRSIFKELDASAGKPPQMIPLTPVKSQSDVKRAFPIPRQISEDIVRSSDRVDDVQIETSDISNKFKFFETYKAPEKERKRFRITPPRDGVVKDDSPDREVYRDPDVVRSEEVIEDPTVAAKTHTATKMLSIFRQLEEQSAQEQVPAGPKPLKRFTPPPEPQRPESDSEGEDDEDDDEEEESEPEVASDVVRAVDKPADEYLIEAQKAARAKQLRAKFEKWEENEIRREQNNSSINLSEEHSEDTIESARSLRARFESMRETTSQRIENKPKVKVHRFVELQVSNNVELCEGCGKRVYPLEKIECNTKAYHKQCFRCLQCNAVLRMDSYTLNQGMLYCIPHFKQLFIAKGNYESGFGLDQHKLKWENQQQQQLTASPQQITSSAH